ncbi:MAG: hypothetical protein AB2693_05035 [Candidatus Thiodiazotropha sp.]
MSNIDSIKEIIPLTDSSRFDVTRQAENKPDIDKGNTHFNVIHQVVGDGEFGSLL